MAWLPSTQLCTSPIPALTLLGQAQWQLLSTWPSVSRQIAFFRERVWSHGRGFFSTKKEQSYLLCQGPKNKIRPYSNACQDKVKTFLLPLYQGPLCAVEYPTATMASWQVSMLLCRYTPQQPKNHLSFVTRIAVCKTHLWEVESSQSYLCSAFHGSVLDFCKPRYEHGLSLVQRLA